MALMTHRPAEFSAHMCRPGTDGASKYGSDFGISSGTAIADQKSSQSNTVQYRICLECTLPLKASEFRQGLECHCAPAEAEDEWLDIGFWEIAFILGLGIACMAVSFWSCF
jgi:hypothetical protein